MVDLEQATVDFRPVAEVCRRGTVCIPCGMVTVMVWEVAPSETSPSSF